MSSDDLDSKFINAFTSMIELFEVIAAAHKNRIETLEAESLRMRRELNGMKSQFEEQKEQVRSAWAIIHKLAGRTGVVE